LFERFNNSLAQSTGELGSFFKVL